MSGRAQWICSNILLHVLVSDFDSENWSCGAGDETSAPGYSSVSVVTPELFLLTLQSQTIFANIPYFLICSRRAVIWLCD